MAEPSSDLLQLLKFMEENRRQEAAERRQEEAARRQEEEKRRREEDEQRRQEFQQLLMTVAAQQSRDATSQPQSPTSTSPGSNSQSPSLRAQNPTKAVIHPPAPLQSDATFPGFKAWRRQWKDYATFTDLATLDLPKQHIQLRMCLTPEVLHILQYRLQVPSDDTRPIDEVLDTLEGHVKDQTNEALRRRDLFSCKQQVGECFNDFYVRVKTLAEAVDM